MLRFFYNVPDFLNVLSEDFFFLDFFRFNISLKYLVFNA